MKSTPYFTGQLLISLDTGTHRSLIEAANYIEAIEERQGLKIACLEEIALENGWIDHAQVEQTATAMGKSNYAEYLRFLLNTRRETETKST